MLHSPAKRPVHDRNVSFDRHNLTIRTFLKRPTRFALDFSKKLDNHSAAVSLHIAYYNFCWRLRENGKSGKLRPTPAMQAGIVPTLWLLEDRYENVIEIDRQRKSDERYAKLLWKLRSGELTQTEMQGEIRLTCSPLSATINHGKKW